MARRSRRAPQQKKYRTERRAGEDTGPYKTTMTLA